MTEPADSEFLERARRGASPSAEDRARVLAATLKALGTDAGSSAIEATPETVAENAPHGFLARAAQGTLGKLVVAGLISGVSGGVGYWLGRSDSARESVSTRDTRDRRAAVSAQVAPPAASTTSRIAPAARSGAAVLQVSPGTGPEPPRVAALPARAAPPGTAHFAASPSERTDEELRLLRRVHRALSDANPRLALALLAELDRLAPRSKLLEERHAAAVMARCQLEPDEAARVASVRAFERRYPQSLYKARIHQTCVPPGSPQQNDE